MGFASANFYKDNLQSDEIEDENEGVISGDE